MKLRHRLIIIVVSIVVITGAALSVLLVSLASSTQMADYDGTEAGTRRNRNGPDARKEKIDEPALQNMEGKNVYIAKVSVPVIYRKTGEVVGRVGVEVNTSYTQPVVDDTIKARPGISAMTVYSNNGISGENKENQL
jgi:hypothetical protein